MGEPLVSVVMAVYERPELLDKTIKSVLRQTERSFEFIIIDDGSNADVKKKLKKYADYDKRIRILTNKQNLGLTKSLNRGLRIARGAYIARIDNGDICRKDRLKVQTEFLNKNKEYGLVGSFVNIIDKKGEKIGEITYPTTDKKIRKGLIRTNMFAHSALMIRKDVIDKLGYYDENFYYAQDYELILRISSNHKLANIPEYLADYLFDPGGVTVSPKKRKKQDWFALKARWLELTRYGYSKKYIFDFLAAYIEYLVPFTVKSMIIKLFSAQGKRVIKIKGKKIIFYKSI